MVNLNLFIMLNVTVLNVATKKMETTSKESQNE
jgi:hypothetical protein